MLTPVEGHTEATYVPRGYAVQADLGAVTGGQASLFRRAAVARTEMLRILDGLVPLRTDADRDDMDSYRSLVRNALERLVDEMGAAGGPRVQMIDQYFRGLTGQQPLTGPVVADTVGGQLGALRDRFGLTDANVNTIEEEGKRTSFWTLVDMVADLQTSWNVQRGAFGGAAGQGFLGTDLILISRLMEAAADQVDELEAVLDSVFIPASERRTIMLDRTTSLTVDGLLAWLHAFLSEEGRRIAQDSGRDGIVSFLAPTAVELVRTFKQTLADRVRIAQQGPVQLLPASCCSPLPAGMLAARTRIAVASLCRLLMDLAQTAQRIGRFPRAVLLNVTVKTVAGLSDVVEVEFRGINLRSVHIPAFVLAPPPDPSVGCRIETYDPDGLLLALDGSSTADDESVSAFFQKSAVHELMAPVLPGGFNLDAGFTVPAESVATVLIDGELGTVVYAPDPRTYPDLQRTGNPLRPIDADAWGGISQTETIRRQPVGPFGGSRSTVDPDAPAPGTGPAPGGSPSSGCGCGCQGVGTGSGCGCGARKAGCGCGDEKVDEATEEYEKQVAALREDEAAALSALAFDKQRKLSDHRVGLAHLFNEKLDLQAEARAAALAQGPQEKVKDCAGDCDGKDHPCHGCGHVWVCGCFTLCRSCSHDHDRDLPRTASVSRTTTVTPGTTRTTPGTTRTTTGTTWTTPETTRTTAETTKATTGTTTRTTTRTTTGTTKATTGTTKAQT